MNRRTLLKATTAGIGAAACNRAMGQSFPSRPIRIISPAPTGSPPDVLARIIANAIGQAQGWTVVVEDKPGGVMTIGANDVLRQRADGYTLLSVSTPISAASALVPSAHLNIETDFTPVIEIGTTYNVLVVNPSVPVHSLAGLIAYLKKSPGKYTFASGGFGTPAHLLGELFKLETGVQTTHVPYKGNIMAIPALLNGTITYEFISAVYAVNLAKSGKLRALVSMSSKRIPGLSDVPTVVEAGYPKLASDDWAGILVRSGTPAPVIAQLNSAINKALKTEKVREALAKIGTDVVGGTPENFGKLIHAEVARWTHVIKSSGIKINP